jgi:hypothetical protein
MKPNHIMASSFPAPRLGGRLLRRPIPIGTHRCELTQRRPTRVSKAGRGGTEGGHCRRTLVRTTACGAMVPTMNRDNESWAWSAPVLEATWRLSRSARSGVHRTAGQGSCPGRRAPGLGGLHPEERCVATGCADLFQDVLLGLAERISVIDEVPVEEAWLRSVVGSQLADLRRQGRVRRGQPARPTRDDGPAGDVVAAIAAAIEDTAEREWLLALFRMIRSYPYRTGRTLVEWPVESWAAEKSLHIGGAPVTPRDVATDIRWMLDVAAATAGAAWVHKTILMPLAAVETHGEGLPETSCRVSVEEHTMLILVAGAFARHRRAGASVLRSWRSSVQLVGGDDSSRPPGWAVELLEVYAAA